MTEGGSMTPYLPPSPPHSEFCPRNVSPLLLQDFPFVVRGPTYIKDRIKVIAAAPCFLLPPCFFRLSRSPSICQRPFLPCSC